jgi:hypothetical protein
VADNDRLAAALAYQGATAAPPTMAQQLAKVPSRLIGALKALGTGSSYGSAEPVNAVNDLARTRFWRGSVFGIPEDVQERNQARAMEAVSMAAPIVYHGTPHRFAATAKNPLGEFDPTKIGTGEGAQAYGYGHYLSEAPSVAKSYQGSVSAMHRASNKATGGVPTIAGKPINWDDPQQIAAFELSRHAGDRVAAADFHARTFLGGDKNEAVKLLRSNAELPKVDLPGQLYKIDLPDEVVPRMLDWDKPLSQQPAEVRKFLSNVSFNPPNQEQKIGEWLKPRLAEGMAPNWADDMRKAGIPGIQYLDAGSRGANTGTRNFVVFPGNEGLLNILGRE